jgi:hypothetical protein
MLRETAGIALESSQKRLTERAPRVGLRGVGRFRWILDRRIRLGYENVQNTLADAAVVKMLLLPVL